MLVYEMRLQPDSLKKTGSQLTSLFEFPCHECFSEMEQGRGIRDSNATLLLPA